MFFDAPLIKNRSTEIDPVRLLREQIHIHYKVLPVTLFTTAVYAIVLAVLLINAVPTTAIVCWLLAAFALIAVRAYSYRNFSRYVGTGQEHEIRWINANLVGVILAGLLWGSCSVFLFPEDIPHQVALLLVVASLGAGSLATATVYPQAIQLYLGLSLLPLIARFFWEGGDTAIMLGLVSTLLYFVLSIAAVRIYMTIRSALETRIAHEQITQDLQLSTEQNRLLLESVSEGIMGCDKDGITTFVNQAAAEILGYTVDELIGAPMHDMIHHCHVDGEFCDLQRTLTDGRAQHLTDELLWSKDDIPIPVEYRSTPLVRGGELSGAVITFSDISDRKAAEARLERQAFYDQLTGLPNRTLLLDRLDQAISYCRRREQIGAVMFLDLDQFKQINDTLGHSQADTLLKQVARRLSDMVRSEDTAARMGGDEFVVLFNELSSEADQALNTIQHIAEKIRKGMAEPFQLNGQELQVTASIGIAIFPMTSETADDVLKQADTAMYMAKAKGRNTAHFFMPSMQLLAEERMVLQNDLRLAVQKKQLELHYQPQLDAYGQLIGVEALLLWRHPERGPLSPHQFIDMAEQTGLILPIGEWVLLHACQMLQRCSDQNSANYIPSMAINISPSQFRQAEFVDQVKDTIMQTGVLAERIELEITETMLSEGFKAVDAKMKSLKTIGVRFSLDDFGTGYSSLTYLKKLPLDKLKIDKSFVQDIVTDTDSAAIVDTIVSMSRHLDLDVIAEGVETQEQVEFLRSKGCYSYQGFLFSKPLAEKELLTYLHELRDNVGRSQKDASKPSLG